MTSLLSILTPILSDIIGKTVSDKTQAGQILKTVTDSLASRQTELSAALRAINTAQIGVNKDEAQHRSLFVAGWRPALGWICSAALFWVFMGEPLITGISGALGYQITLPQLPSDLLFELIFGMLGLAGLRSLEKIKGVSR